MKLKHDIINCYNKPEDYEITLLIYETSLLLLCITVRTADLWIMFTYSSIAIK
jgi:hypothetical protein